MNYAMAKKQTREQAMARWARTLRHLRDAPSSSNTYIQRGDHFSFSIAGESTRVAVDDADERLVTFGSERTTRN